MMVSLYPQQDQVVSEVKHALDIYGNTLLQAPTGGGKTRMAASLMQGVNRSAFIMPRKSLIEQASNSLNDLGIDHTFIASGRERNPFIEKYLISLHTIDRRYDELQDAPFDLGIVDETHFSVSMIERLFEWGEQRGVKFVGLSATPWRFDGKGLGNLYNHMVQAPDVRWHIDNGYLSDYKIYAPSAPDLKGVKTQGGDYHKGQLNARMEQERRLIGDAVEHYRKLAMGRLAICYCSSVNHAYDVADMFTSAGIPAGTIEGSMPEKEQARIIKQFARREILILTNSDIATFGFDLSNYVGGANVTIECMIDLKPTQSLAMQLQKNGRALRKKKEHAIILDHAGNVHRHKLPCMAHEWTLADRKKKNNASSETSIQQCEECFYVYDKGEHEKCPECGHFEKKRDGTGRNPLETEDGNLEEIIKIDGKFKQRYETAMADTMDKLVYIAKRRRYKKPEYWSANVLKKRMQNRAKMNKAFEHFASGQCLNSWYYTKDTYEAVEMTARIYCREHMLTKDEVAITKRDGQILVKIR